MELVNVWDDHTDQEVDQGDGPEEHQPQQQEQGKALADHIILEIIIHIIVIEFAWKSLKEIHEGTLFIQENLTDYIYPKPLRRHGSH